jgi:hypothetical protein
LLFRVLLGSQEVERHIDLITDNPTVMARRTRGNIEEGPGWTHVRGAAVDDRGGAAGQDEAYVFDVAMRRPHTWSYVPRPAPSRFVCAPPDRQPAKVNDLKLSFVKDADLIGLLKTFQNDVQHDSSPLIGHGSCHAHLRAVLQDLARGRVDSRCYKPATSDPTVMKTLCHACHTVGAKARDYAYTNYARR